MKNKQTPLEILQKHEDANEMHFHEVDRKWIVEAMEEYAKEKSEIPIIFDEEIIIQSKSMYANQIDDYEDGFIDGAKWYREQLKSKQ